jgi:hypothetical protein
MQIYTYFFINQNYLIKISDFYQIFYFTRYLLIKERIMARPKLKEENKKGKLGITISKELIEKINQETNNKSTFVEMLVSEYFKNK